MTYDETQKLLSNYHGVSRELLRVTQFLHTELWPQEEEFQAYMDVKVPESRYFYDKYGRIESVDVHQPTILRVFTRLTPKIMYDQLRIEADRLQARREEIVRALEVNDIFPDDLYASQNQEADEQLLDQDKGRGKIMANGEYKILPPEHDPSKDLPLNKSKNPVVTTETKE